LKRRKYYVLAVLAFALLAWYQLWSAMQYHGTVALGRGYKYFYTDSGVYLDSERAAGIGPDVDGYRVYRRIIAGHVAKERDRNSYGDRIPTLGNSKPGYFMINLRNNSIYDGLSRQEWLNKLRGFGITSEPHLYRPSIYDELLGRNKPAE